MGRNSCCVKDKLRKGLWSPEEDEKLYNYITRFGVGCWSSVPKLAGLQRCGKSCRLRWINYLRPDLKRGMFSQEEEDLIISLHESLGNRWAQIAAQLPGRTDNEIKNFWNSYLKKKLTKQGIDPNTHKPIIHKTQVKDEKQDCLDSASPQFLGPNGMPNLSTSVWMEQHPYHSNTTDIGQAQAPPDNFSSKQVYDPTFLSEFQANTDPSGYNSNFVSHYLQNQIEGTDHTNPITGFAPVQNLDHQNVMPRDYSDSSSSRMSKYSTNKAKESSSSSSMIDNADAFCWGTETNKMDSMFQFQFSGIQIEDRNPSLWQQGQDEDFSNYPITSLSQELTSNEANIDVFQQI